MAQVPMLLKSLSFSMPKKAPDKFPFNVPVMQSLALLEFTSPVTFLVGENGSGKSTFLEALACAAGSITVGSEGVDSDKTLSSMRVLAKHLKLEWTKKTRRGFFMRSEDFFGYARRMNQMREELQRDMENIDNEFEGRSEMARGLARMPYMRELGELKRFYGEGLDAQSHGESYFKLFQARFVPEGLYLLDEPEAPLSPLRQLSFLSMLKEMIDLQAQFVIATHSPIILAYPGATILSFDDGKIGRVNYDELEHVSITRNFLNDPKPYLRHLLD